MFDHNIPLALNTNFWADVGEAPPESLIALPRGLADGVVGRGGGGRGGVREQGAEEVPEVPGAGATNHKRSAAEILANMTIPDKRARYTN